MSGDRITPDSSVLIAGFDRLHPFCSEARTALAEVRDRGLLVAHTVAETFAVLTGARYSADAAGVVDYLRYRVERDSVETTAWTFIIGPSNLTSSEPFNQTIDTSAGSGSYEVFLDQDSKAQGNIVDGWAFPDKERYRWYVSFPPFPAAVILPAVAALGVDLPDRLFWALVGGLGPMLLLLLLGRLRDLGLSDRKRWEDLVLTALFAFGTVFFYVAVQGTVWFAAHVVAVPLILLFLRFALGAERPVLAGLMLGLCFLTRPTTAALALFFALQKHLVGGLTAGAVKG